MLTGITHVRRTIRAGERDRQDRVITIIRHHLTNLMINIGIPTNLAGLNTTASVMTMEGQMTGMISQETMADLTADKTGIITERRTEATINQIITTEIIAEIITTGERETVIPDRIIADQSTADVSLESVGVGIGVGFFSVKKVKSV